MSARVWAKTSGLNTCTLVVATSIFRLKLPMLFTKSCARELMRMISKLRLDIDQSMVFSC